MILVADIGGSHTRLSINDVPDSLEEPIVYDTPADFNDAISTFARAAMDISKGRPITSGVVGIAGTLSADRRVLLRSPHLRGWENRDVAATFGQAIGAPVRFENDVALGALGEATRGAGVGASIIAYVAVGTGVNGARVVDGKIDVTALGFEIGHQRLDIGADAQELEELVSGSALFTKYGRPASEITDPDIWNECADILAIGLYNTILHWSPERIVLGGSLLLGTHGIPVERVNTALQSINTALPALPEIRLAALGDSSVLSGASFFSILNSS